VSLSWAAAPGAAGYDIFRATGAGTPVTINPTRLPVTSYTAEGLTPSTTYSFKVKAYNAAGAASADSNTVTIVTGATVACFMASNFAHVQAGRAHDRGGSAFANGSDERMGLNNLFFITTLKQTGPNFYVVDNLTCP
jgi:poly(3-hydroxybutyrate) depolymerase